MLTDKQSLLIIGIFTFFFVFFGILGILENIFIAAPMLIGFFTLIINLIITKRVSEEEENKLEEKKVSIEETQKSN
ncbi:hypothetical protein KO494_04830 [Lacinutrix sp. C3R15]|uniref:hypothetical protein n=1 Tax=Flavobacteriaceae TaxID=49546 RepID=UPI001C0928D6|nr:MULTISPECIES: hypothetical protein [Flavobacteriaceae]MBU2938862.1 hypothetical protein [Lacinutrix sp. C3R15]MDO6622175.1 hypothetical protein [Oceanihabitans sp. 1_MG-2023]